MSEFRRKLSSNAGFTLIELLVVIAIIGILAGIAIPRLGGVRDKAEIASVKSDLRNIQTGLEVYYADEGEYPTSISAIDTYVDNVNSSDYSGDYTRNATDDYTISNVSVGSISLTATPGGISEN